jgi:5-methylcytosine-specific restriction endonuclease McrA
VRERDGEQCAFVSDDGRRCGERGGLEFHHLDPYARGGEHTVDNVALVCRGHNGYFAVRDFGAAHMGRFRSRAEEARAEYRPAAKSSRRLVPGVVVAVSHQRTDRARPALLRWPLWHPAPPEAGPAEM